MPATAPGRSGAGGRSPPGWIGPGKAHSAARLAALLVLLAIILVAAPLGVVILRRNRSRSRIEGDPAIRARAAGAQLGKEIRAYQWRNRPHDKSEDNLSGGGGCGGGE
ncbi:hypothetical protein [Nocardia exalbida]|uniref:hypothetical protein n=1 Tax=Nocardia exalbida TaxID=290231 RepID=UPI0012F6BFC7|nr:hypothetical protein [Nocardia exalbida]